MTSAEPCRRKAYHSDLRWRVVWQRLALNLTFEQIATNLNIAVSTAKSVFSLFEITGDVALKLVDGPRIEQRKLDDHMELFILGLILEKPSLYLSEICDMVERVSTIKVSQATICRLLKRHGLTRKKVRQVALQRSDSLRGIFIAQALMYKRELFVCLDETGGNNRNCIRKYGYALRGETPKCHRMLVRGRRFSAIAAICTEGLVALELKSGSSVDSQVFYDFIRGDLIPQMNPFDGSSPKSIVIMDNCAVHHVLEVKQLFDAVGIPVFFLPPYSPDYNPIEETFSYVKYYLKQHDELIQRLGNPEVIVRAAFNSITPSQCKGWIDHCGYQ